MGAAVWGNIDIRVLGSKFVPVFTVCLSPFFRRGSGHTKCEASGIGVALWGKYLGLGPTPAHSFEDHGGRYAKFIGPLSDGLGYSKMLNASVVTPVVVLLFSGRPAAIVRRVVTIIINAVNAVATGTFRARAHVLAEGFKAIPPWADLYTPCAVVNIIRRGWVAAPPPHLNPDLIDRGARLPVFWLCAHT